MNTQSHLLGNIQITAIVSLWQSLDFVQLLLIDIGISSIHGISDICLMEGISSLIKTKKLFPLINNLMPCLWLIFALSEELMN